MYPKDLVYSEASPEDITYIQGNNFQNLNTLIAIPTRGMIHCKVIINWKSMLMPLNSQISNLFIEGMEVGYARNKSIELLLDNPNNNYILFLDDDVIVPSDLLLRLFRGITEEGYDIISGLYHQKNNLKTPLAFKDIDTILHPISKDEELSEKLFEVDIVPMGCTLIKKSVFNKLQMPYFKTVVETDGKYSNSITEDVYFCRKAKEAGLKIGIHTGLRCGHLMTSTGIIY